MANKKISELDVRASLALADLLVVGDPANGYAYKTTITDLKTITGAGVISFNGRVGAVVPVEGDYTLNQLSDVILTSSASGQFLRYNGSNWVNSAIQAGDIPDISGTYVTIATAQTITGVKTISSALTLSDLAGASTRMVVASAAGLLSTQAIPTGTVTSVGVSVGTAGTDIAVSGSPITSSGTITIDIPTASATNRGALSAADFSTFSAKQDALSGTGIVKSTSGTISYLTDNSSNWNTAYDNMIVSAAVSGTTTKTLTLTQQDAGTITASWTDDNTDAVTSVFGRTGAVVATNGDYNTDQVTEGSSNLYYTDTRARASISETITGIDYNSTTGVFSISSGYGIPTTASQTTWDAAYNDKINSAAVTGTTTKTLTLTQQDGGTITASWSDLNTGSVTGSGSANQIAVWTGTSAIASSATFTFSSGGELYVGPSNTAGSGLAVGMNLYPTLIAGANNDVLSSLLIRGTFTNGAYTGVQNWLIIAEGSNNRYLKYSQYGLWLKQNDNTHVTALNLENTHGVGHGVGMNFTLGYGGTGINVGTPIVGGRIEARPDTSWTSTASTQDSSLILSTTLNGALGTALTLKSDKSATFESSVQMNGDLQLLGTNPRIDFPSGSSLRLYQSGVGTKFEIAAGGDVTVTNDFTVSGKASIGGVPESGVTLTLRGNGVDSPLLKMIGFANTTAILGDITTGTSDVGFLSLYNNGTIRIKLDADTGGLSYINANRFIVGATTSNNAKFRVRNDDTDVTYFSKIQAVFGPSDYLDSDSATVFGGGTSETQFTNGNASRPAMISLGGSLNVDEAIGVINFFRSGNTDGYRSRIQIFAQLQSTGTANQHGAYLEFRTANDGVQNPAALFQLEARGALRIFRRDINMTFPDSVGGLYVRQNGNHAGTEEEFRIAGRNIGFFSHTGTRHAGINSSGVLGIGYAGTPAATSKLFISRSDQYGLHLDAQNGFARIQTTDDNLYLNAGGVDRLALFSNGFDLQTNVTGAAVTQPISSIRETGISRTITGFNYDVVQPLVMMMTQTSPTILALTRFSDDAVGAGLKGIKARGNASTPNNPSNGDVCFAVEGWALHGAGPNLAKFGGGMRFVKDDAYGTANVYAPMRTEFYNAVSTTAIQNTFVIYPNGNVVATGDVTAYSDARVKKNVNTIENALEKTMKLRGVSYFRTDTDIDKKKIGVIAQEIRDVLPEVVLEDEKGSLSVSYGNMVGLLIEAVKEQQKQIDELKKQVA